MLRGAEDHRKNKMADTLFTLEGSRLTREQIAGILPQRDPILLPEEAVLCADCAQSAMYLDPGWELFAGHFPDSPVLPGVWLTEGMAQTADLILLSRQENMGKKPLFAGISRMRFLRPALPGQTVLFSAEIVLDAGGGLYDCKVKASVDQKTCAMGTITLAMR